MYLLHYMPQPPEDYAAVLTYPKFLRDLADGMGTPDPNPNRYTYHYYYYYNSDYDNDNDDDNDNDTTTDTTNTSDNHIAHNTEHDNSVPPGLRRRNGNPRPNPNICNNQRSW